MKKKNVIFDVLYDPIVSAMDRDLQIVASWNLVQIQQNNVNYNFYKAHVWPSERFIEIYNFFLKKLPIDSGAVGSKVPLLHFDRAVNRQPGFRPGC